MQGLEVKKIPKFTATFSSFNKYRNKCNYAIEPRFNDVYSRINLQNRIKKGAYVINLDEYENTGPHWVSLFVKPKYTVYFDSFGIEHIPNDINKFIRNEIYLEYKRTIQLCVDIFV